MRAGNVSDVLKFALLRALAGNDRTLGVAWYYAPGDDGRVDGRHLEWRDEPAWRQLNAQLYTALSMLSERSIAALKRATIGRKRPYFIASRSRPIACGVRERCKCAPLYGHWGSAGIDTAVSSQDAVHVH